MNVTNRAREFDEAANREPDIWVRFALHLMERDKAVHDKIKELFDMSKITHVKCMLCGSIIAVRETDNSGNPRTCLCNNTTAYYSNGELIIGSMKKDSAKEVEPTWE